MVRIAYTVCHYLLTTIAILVQIGPVFTNNYCYPHSDRASIY